MAKAPQVQEETVREIEPWMAVLPMVRTSDDAMADMIQGILTADSIDAALAVSETIGLEDLVGETLIVRGASLRESQIDEGYPVYAVIDAVMRDTGEKVVITTGALKVVAQLCKFQMMNAWPVTVRTISIQSQSNAKRHVLQFVVADPATDF